MNITLKEEYLSSAYQQFLSSSENWETLSIN